MDVFKHTQKYRKWCNEVPGSYYSASAITFAYLNHHFLILFLDLEEILSIRF